MKYELGSWVETSYGPSGKIIAYTDQPTYTLEGPDGSRSSVVESTIVNVFPQFTAPNLPTKYGAVVLIETEMGRWHFLAWRAADNWDVLNPRGEAATTNDPYQYAREWSASTISAVTILREDNS
jgi:hypothetical protein